MIKLKIDSLNEINFTVREFIKKMNNKKIFAFYGKMGVGKTTFIKAVCEEFGVKDNISSPSFAIVNEYLTLDNKIIYHFDFYRIKDIEEAYDFGYEDYFYSNNYCFIEWPEKIEAVLPPDTVSVKLIENADGTRSINIDS